MQLTLCRLVFMSSARLTATYVGGILQWPVTWSKPDSYAEQMVQDLLRYMVANQRQVVHFKELAQLRSGGVDASFYSILLHAGIQANICSSFG